LKECDSSLTTPCSRSGNAARCDRGLRGYKVFVLEDVVCGVYTMCYR